MEKSTTEKLSSIFCNEGRFGFKIRARVIGTNNLLCCCTVVQVFLMNKLHFHTVIYSLLGCDPFQIFPLFFSSAHTQSSLNLTLYMLLVWETVNNWYRFTVWFCFLYSLLSNLSWEKGGGGTFGYFKNIQSESL